MLIQTVADYQPISDVKQFPQQACGYSDCPRNVISYILPDPSGPVQVLDIGFGVGGQAEMIKRIPALSHWTIDGVDGFEPNCYDQKLISKKL